ncbi:hypothetical protein L596_029283 [Steinernema carpocapsae]|uniref:Uncharacterized protein n=1 Tax=Steinernema carpocapsae TaxID=34508 RepID=A0A4U5LU64_STECR|nr:hypothetical protein L596_029283 [Steinernema carpocapsae]
MMQIWDIAFLSLLGSVQLSTQSKIKARYTRIEEAIYGSFISTGKVADIGECSKKAYERGLAFFKLFYTPERNRYAMNCVLVSNVKSFKPEIYPRHFYYSIDMRKAENPEQCGFAEKVATLLNAEESCDRNEKMCDQLRVARQHLNSLNEGNGNLPSVVIENGISKVRKLKETLTSPTLTITEFLSTTTEMTTTTLALQAQNKCEEEFTFSPENGMCVGVVPISKHLKENDVLEFCKSVKDTAKLAAVRVKEENENIVSILAAKHANLNGAVIDPKVGKNTEKEVKDTVGQTFHRFTDTANETTYEDGQFVVVAAVGNPLSVEPGKWTIQSTMAVTNGAYGIACEYLPL